MYLHVDAATITERGPRRVRVDEHRVRTARRKGVRREPAHDGRAREANAIDVRRRIPRVEGRPLQVRIIGRGRTAAAERCRRRVARALVD
eukprot:4547095-Prymnesium_polylepis.1